MAARERLAIGAEERIALLHGAGHSEQEPQVVEQAFASGALPGVSLVVAGRMADRLEDRAVARLVVPGFVPTQQRLDLLAAADMVLLSFRDGCAL